MNEDNAWRVEAVKWGFPSVTAMFTAIAVVLVWRHDDLSQLDELVTALAQGTRDILLVILGGGGIAFGAYHVGKNGNRQGSE